MEAKLTLPPELVEQIADKVIERLIPYLEDKEQDEILSVNQVAVLLGKTKGSVYQLVNDSSHGLSDFPYQKAGRLLRFSKRDVLNWMKKNSKPLESR